jgi:hypothetical protein
MFSVLRKRLTLRGFIVWDFAARQADFLRDMGEWVSGGRVKYREDVVEGLESAPAAFLGLLQGKNFGRTTQPKARLFSPGPSGESDRGADKIALGKLDAAMPQNIVGGRVMKIEVG